MTAVDICVLLLVGGAAFMGLMRGFVAEALSLIAWVLAVFAVKFAHAPVAHALTATVGTSAGAAVLAFAIVFGVTFFVGKRVAASIGQKSRQSVIGPFDRVLGLGFGALKGLIGATLMFLGFTLVYDTAYGAPNGYLSPRRIHCSRQVRLRWPIGSMRDGRSARITLSRYERATL
jgi:membrane protein required for colicin V production